MAEAEIAIVRIAPETSFKNKAYEALKEAILKMDIYATPEQVMLDERALSERLGVSRTPIREAIAMLEQDGFVKTVPRRGIVVVRRTKNEIVDMIRAWAALESMAARLITTTARKKDISALRDFFRDFGKDRLPQDHIEEYSKANIAFHQALISLSESPVLVDMTNDILLHVRGYRQLTIGRVDRTATSCGARAERPCPGRAPGHRSTWRLRRRVRSRCGHRHLCECRPRSAEVGARRRRILRAVESSTTVATRY